MRVGKILRITLPLLVAPAIAAADNGSKTPQADPWTPEPSVVSPPDPNRLPGSTNGTGVIITPPAGFPDAREYPYGMVIRPPNVDPDMVIAPSSIGGSLRALGRGFQDALGAAARLFQQH